MEKGFNGKQAGLFVILFLLIIFFSGIQPSFEVNKNGIKPLYIEFTGLFGDLLNKIYFPLEKQIELQMPIVRSSPQRLLDTSCVNFPEGPISDYDFAECSGKLNLFFENPNLPLTIENERKVQEICESYPASALCDPNKIVFKDLDKTSLQPGVDGNEYLSIDEESSIISRCMVEEVVCEADCQMGCFPESCPEGECDRCSYYFDCCLVDAGLSVKIGHLEILDTCYSGIPCDYPKACIAGQDGRWLGAQDCRSKRDLSGVCCVGGCVDPDEDCSSRGGVICGPGNWCIGEIEEYNTGDLVGPSHCCTQCNVITWEPPPPPPTQYTLILGACSDGAPSGIFQSPPDSFGDVSFGPPGGPGGPGGGPSGGGGGPSGGGGGPSGGTGQGGGIDPPTVHKPIKKPSGGGGGGGKPIDPTMCWIKVCIVLD